MSTPSGSSPKAATSSKGRSRSAVNQVWPANNAKEVNIMKRRQFTSLPLLVLFLTMTSTVLASNTWYADGVNGSDANDCQTAMTACKTIGHAISLASSGDSVIVAAATYTENLTIGFSLNVIGSGANTAIIDGGGGGTVVAIPNTTSHVAISNLTIRNGRADRGGGIFNAGTLTIYGAIISGNSATFGPA